MYSLIGAADRAARRRVRSYYIFLVSLVSLERPFYPYELLHTSSFIVIINSYTKSCCMPRERHPRESAAAKRARLEADIILQTIHDGSVGAGTDVATVMPVFNVS